MEQPSATASRRPRSDVVRNRGRLIAAAREVFGEGGTDTSLDAVARRAGVGIGTLYRHFSTRDALFQAVYLHEVDELVALAGALDAEPDAVGALRRWVHANIGMIATKRGMLVALAPSPDHSKELFAESRERLLGALDSLMERARRAGSLRSDIAADAVLRAFYGICYSQDEADWHDNATRLVDVFLDGLRAGPQLSPSIGFGEPGAQP